MIRLFILLILVGCELNDDGLSPIEFQLLNELGANGFVNVVYDTSAFQSFYRLSGILKRNNKPMNLIKMGWWSDYYWDYNGFEVPIVNSSSYCDANGIVNTMMGIVPMLVGDTVWINYGYHDNWTYKTTYGEIGVIVR
tara:strand:+ start:988 stop:1401 length:414 start_codon:yes stop_codon:yes gene_type:complete